MLNQINSTVFAVATVVISTLLAEMPIAKAQQQHVVEIRKFKFIPDEVNVSPGDTIVWINRDIVPHTITATDKSWDSGKIAKAGQWQTVAGKQMPSAYFCRFHPTMKAQFNIVQ